MTYYIRINERASEFTDADKKIGAYILANPDEIIDMNSKKLAQKTATSQSAIIRFVQKIGYKGYLDLKVDIAKSLEEKIEVGSEIIGSGDSMEEIINKSKLNVISSVEKTFALIERKSIEEIVSILISCDSVYLAGVGSSGLVCEDFAYKLMRAGKKANYERDSHTNLTLITNIEVNDLLICISYGGETKEIQLAAEFARSKGAKVVSITKKTKGRLPNLSDYLVVIPEIEKNIRYGAISSRFSSQIITDILFYGYISANMDEVVKKLKLSKDLTDRLK